MKKRYYAIIISLLLIAVGGGALLYNKPTEVKPVILESLREAVKENNKITNLVVDNSVAYLIIDKELDETEYIKICEKISSGYFNRENHTNSLTLIVGSKNKNFYSMDCNIKGKISVIPDPNSIFPNSKGKWLN